MNLHLHLYRGLFRSGCVGAGILVPVALFQLIRFSPWPRFEFLISVPCGLLCLVGLGALLLVLGVANELGPLMHFHQGRVRHARRLLGFLTCVALVAASLSTSVRLWVRTELQEPTWRSIAEGRTRSVHYAKIDRGLPISCRLGTLGAVVVIPEDRDVVEFAGVIEEWPDGYANALALARSEMHTVREVAAAFGDKVSVRRYRGKWFYVIGL